MEIGKVIKIGDRPREPIVIPTPQQEPIREPVKEPQKEKEKEKAHLCCPIGARRDE